MTGKLVSCGSLPVKRMYSRLSDAYYDRSTEPSDVLDGICVEFDGTECMSKTKKIYAKKRYNDDIIGYLVAMTAGFDNPDLNTKLLRAEAYNGQNGTAYGDINSGNTSKNAIESGTVEITNKENAYALPETGGSGNKIGRAHV